MPQKYVWLFAAIALTASPARAGDDMVYQFEPQAPISNVDAESLKLDSIEFQDRTWTTPGVEQATHRFPPAKTFDFANTQLRFRFDGDGPCWLDDACFPLTRELFHQCERYPNFSVVMCDSQYVPHLETRKVYLAH